MGINRVLMLGLIIAASTTVVSAEPYIAFREGYKCSACHLNRTGGGMRNDFGGLFTQTDMSPLMEKASEQAMDFSPQVGNSITLGADFMAIHEVLFSVDEEVNDQRYDQDSSTSFDIRSGNLYVEANLIPERLSLYIDETVTPGGASSREAFMLMRGLPFEGYLKAGRMLLPYGIRVWDDETFTRQVTGFNYDNQDMGIEFGFEPQNLFLAVALSNGTQGGRDTDTDKQISSVASVYLKNAIVGGSFARNKFQGIERTAYGPYVSLRLGVLTVFGEVDWVQDSGTFDQDQFIAFGSLNYWHREAINLRVAFDFLNPHNGVEEDESSRLTLSAHAFLTPFLQASAAYKIRDSIPQDARGNADALTVALHSFF